MSEEFQRVFYALRSGPRDRRRIRMLTEYRDALECWRVIVAESSYQKITADSIIGALAKLAGVPEETLGGVRVMPGRIYPDLKKIARDAAEFRKIRGEPVWKSLK